MLAVEIPRLCDHIPIERIEEEELLQVPTSNQPAAIDKLQSERSNRPQPPKIILSANGCSWIPQPRERRAAEAFGMGRRPLVRVPPVAGGTSRHGLWRHLTEPTLLSHWWTPADLPDGIGPGYGPLEVIARNKINRHRIHTPGGRT
ncbi:hypothetical protein GCM10022254_11680 [Actinomadura meridiana]|uniref:Transposase n=1 Tax=Actinomadura meridiana TaxID=559626 RepID=A0ABP8BUK9_9ACTN